MERSGSQKFLRVISVINIVFAVIGIALGIFIIAAGGMYATSPDATAIEGMSASDAGMTVIVSGVLSILESILQIFIGILGLRASNDSSKVNLLWWFTLVGLVNACVSAVTTFVGGNINPNTIGSIIGSLAATGSMFWVVNNIKNQ